MFLMNKMPIAACKFLKIFRESMPPTPSKIIFVSLFASNLTFPEKIRLVLKIGAKSSKYTPLTWTHFLKRVYICPFPGLTYLHSVNVLPNSKLYPPHQNFLDLPLQAVGEL